MYEFVIRYDSEISPLFEVNIFGFIKDVAIRQVGDVRHDHDNWEELYEYVMSVIDINTIANFSDYGNKVFDLDYRDYVLGNECFLWFVKFDFEEFVEFICEDFIESRYQ